MIKQNHFFHLVFASPWPLLTGLNTMSMLISVVFFINMKNIKPNLIIIMLTIMIVIQWWRDVSRESTLQGFHTNIVMNGLRWGMILFIISEILFFFSFFWAFFHSSLAPNFELGNIWPPMGLETINPFQIPLLNTTALLSSGVTVTLSHHALILKKNSTMKTMLQYTVILGVYFTLLQMWEYKESFFCFSDSSYGSTFFITTGFHGIHVMVGTILLTSMLMRQMMNYFSNNHHFGYEAAIWYWHFVDVVWLFVFIFLYWWSF